MEARRRHVSDREVRNVLELIEPYIPRVIDELNRCLQNGSEELYTTGQTRFGATQVITKFEFDRHKLAAIEQAVEILEQNGWKTNIYEEKSNIVGGKYLTIEPDIEWLKKNEERFKKHAKAEGQDDAK